MNFKFYKNFNLKKLALSLTVALGFGLQGYSQTVEDFHKCGNDIQKLSQQYPDFMQAYQDFEANWASFINGANLRWFETTHDGKYIIPVVVHVLHLGGNENISATQVKSQITALNTHFAMQANGIATVNAFTPFDTIIPHFSGNADQDYSVHGWKNYYLNCDTTVFSPDSIVITCADTLTVPDTLFQINKFVFRLATLDPQGNCTDGIVRVYTEKADDAQNETRFKQISNWDRSKYFNLWVIKSFPDASLLGYAQFPFAFGSQFPLTSTDGVAVINTSFGSTGTSAGNTGSTTTHEAGHWLGLFHIWGDADCGSDGIDDTPIHKTSNFSSSSCFPLPKTATCYTDTNGTDTNINQLNLIKRNQIGEMWMNFMDYTDDNCQWVFSEQQYRKMNVTMESVSFRHSLSTNDNLLATGTNDGATPCQTSPKADLWSRDGTNNFILEKLICAGGDLTFRDGTHNLSNTGADQGTREWAFEGGTPGTSTASAPLITYDTPGLYDVKLTATNNVGSNTKVWDNYVRVLSTTADEANFTYYDDFEYSTSLYEQGKWITINQGINSNNKWVQATNTGYQSAKSMVMRNSNNIIFEQDFLISASYDMTTITNDKLYFRYAGARKTANPFISQNDRLTVYVSTNCGENWASRPMRVKNVVKGYLSGDTLYSAGLVSGNFVPNNNSDWTLAEVDLNTAPYNVSPNLRVMWVWTSGGPYGNDFYIDQINITNSQEIGIEDEADQMEYSVYPNPVSSTSQIYFKLPVDGKVTLDVVDITGRTVKTIFAGDLNAGEQYYQLNNADFQAAGIYMVRLTVNGVVSTKKVIIE